MSSTAPVDPHSLLAAYGPLAMELKSRPSLVLHDGDRNRFADRTPRPAVDLKLICGTDQTK